MSLGGRSGRVSVLRIDDNHPGHRAGEFAWIYRNMEDTTKQKTPIWKQILLSLGSVILLLVFGSPFYFIGEYQSNSRNKAEIDSLNDKLNKSNSLVAFQSGEHGRLMREQRIEIMEEKKQDLDRIMLICNAAAAKSEKASESSTKAVESVKSVLDTVKESNDVQVDAIRETLEKGQKK